MEFTSSLVGGGEDHVPSTKTFGAMTETAAKEWHRKEKSARLLGVKAETEGNFCRRKRKLRDGVDYA